MVGEWLNELTGASSLYVNKMESLFPIPRRLLDVRIRRSLGIVPVVEHL